MKKNQNGFIFWMIPFFTTLFFLVAVTLLSVREGSYWVTPFGVTGIAAMLYWVKLNFFDTLYDDIIEEGQEEKAP